MPSVSYLKVFKGRPNYNNPEELGNLDGVKTIRAGDFPHTEPGLVVVALVKVGPYFNGVFRIRIPDTSKDYWVMGSSNPKNEPHWLTLTYGEVDVVFPEAGSYTVDLSCDDIPIHKTSLTVKTDS